MCFNSDVGKLHTSMVRTPWSNGGDFCPWSMAPKERESEELSLASERRRGPWQPDLSPFIAMMRVDMVIGLSVRAVPTVTECCVWGQQPLALLKNCMKC